MLVHWASDDTDTEPVFHPHLKEPYKDPDDINNFDREKQTLQPKEGSWRVWGERNRDTDGKGRVRNLKFNLRDWGSGERNRKGKNLFPRSNHTVPFTVQGSRAPTRDTSPLLPAEASPSCRSQFSNDTKRLCPYLKITGGEGEGAILDKVFAYWCFLQWWCQLAMQNKYCVRWGSCGLVEKQQSLYSFRLENSPHPLDTEDNNKNCSKDSKDQMRSCT